MGGAGSCLDWPEAGGDSVESQGARLGVQWPHGAENAGKIHLGTFNHPPMPSFIHFTGSLGVELASRPRSGQLIGKERKSETPRLDLGKWSPWPRVQILARREIGGQEVGRVGPEREQAGGRQLSGPPRRGREGERNPAWVRFVLSAWPRGSGPRHSGAGDSWGP